MSDGRKWTGWDILLITISVCLLWYVFHGGISFDRFTNAGAKIADKVKIK